MPWLPDGPHWLIVGLLPPVIVVYRSGAPFAGDIVCQPGPGTIKVPGPGRGQAGRDEQCPG